MKDLLSLRERLAMRLVPSLRLGDGLPLIGTLTIQPVERRTGAPIGPAQKLRNTITTVGKGFIVDAWQNLVELEIMKYHGVGTGTNAAAAGDTALQTELTTEYTGDVRGTGTIAEASATVFQSVATVSFDSGTPAVTEWGLFSQAATGGGVMFSRRVFAAINVSSTVSIQFTWELTVG